MRISDVMTKTVTCVSPETPALDAARIMLNAKVSGLPVTDHQGRVLGMLSESDLMRSLPLKDTGLLAGLLSFLIGNTSAADLIGASNKPVGEMMCHPPIVIRDDQPLQDALTLMQHHHVKRLPVIRDGKLVGLLARHDLLRAAVDLVESTAV